MKSICIFCSSSKYISESYNPVVAELAKHIVTAGFEMIWGGVDVGMMGYIARQVQENGGVVRGILPKTFLQLQLEYKNADELLITNDMSMRKNMMISQSDAFICLPGGFGTLEEILEVITLKQLGYHNKPIVFLDINGYFGKLFSFVNHMISEKFVKESQVKLYNISDNPIKALEYILNYKPHPLENKW